MLTTLPDLTIQRPIFRGVFDKFFKGLSWRSAGHVTAVEIEKGGGINQIEVAIEADDQGYIELKTAGFNVRPTADKSS
jgi:hypothetical protein